MHDIRKRIDETTADISSVSLRLALAEQEKAVSILQDVVETARINLSLATEGKSNDSISMKYLSNMNLSTTLHDLNSLLHLNKILTESLETFEKKTEQTTDFNDFKTSFGKVNKTIEKQIQEIKDIAGGVEKLLVTTSEKQTISSNSTIASSKGMEIRLTNNEQENTQDNLHFLQNDPDKNHTNTTTQDQRSKDSIEMIPNKLQHFANINGSQLSWEGPDLSVVMVTRNDNYGGDALMRFTRSLQQWLHFQWTIAVEVVIVEWNIAETGMKNIYREEQVKKVSSVYSTANLFLNKKV